MAPVHGNSTNPGRTHGAAGCDRTQYLWNTVNPPQCLAPLKEHEEQISVRLVATPETQNRKPNTLRYSHLQLQTTAFAMGLVVSWAWVFFAALQFTLLIATGLRSSQTTTANPKFKP